MARSINGNLIGAAARVDLQDQKESEDARRAKFSREWKQTNQALAYFMGDSFDKWFDDQPEKTCGEMLPVMKVKLEELDGTLEKTYAHIDSLVGEEGIKQSQYDDLAELIKGEGAE
jgi:hypothetical protein